MKSNGETDLPGARSRIVKKTPILVDRSPLRIIDPRVKLTMSVCASLAAMLPIERLAIFAILYLVFIGWARLLPSMARQIWRLKWVLLALFLLDWLTVGVGFAILITIRLILLTGGFTLLTATVSPTELLLALERLRIPYRYAFSLSLAFQSLGFLEEEWLIIQEAQRSRGAGFSEQNHKRIVDRIADLTSFTVPAIVLTTKRAWALTESAHARGFDSPKRRPYKNLNMSHVDWLLLLGTGVIYLGLTFWKM